MCESVLSSNHVLNLVLSVHGGNTMNCELWEPEAKNIQNLSHIGIRDNSAPARNVGAGTPTTSRSTNNSRDETYCDFLLESNQYSWRFNNFGSTSLWFFSFFGFGSSLSFVRSFITTSPSKILWFHIITSPSIIIYSLAALASFHHEIHHLLMVVSSAKGKS